MVADRGVALIEHTLANPTEVKVLHNEIDFQVNFDTKTIDGTVKLTVKKLAESVKELHLDTSQLDIKEVSSNGQPLQFGLAEPHKVLGSQLTIQLPSGLSKDHEAVISIRYTTAPTASAIQFLEPEQTADGKHPYLFTQCQAIHARSLLPCQDTPLVKSSYSSTVRVPSPLTALMSAVIVGEPAEEGQQRVFRFEQKEPIPSYLIALAVGQLENRQIGPKTWVWSEPSVVEAAAYEFANTDKYLQTAIELAGDYVWGTYSVLVLPPSFPYGGMENTNLTFATPTLLAGDRSLDRVVCHEIAHSWSGNLVTTASWRDFWLNEGWTMFLERKIAGRLEGKAAFDFGAAQGATALADAIKSIGPQHNFTRLVPDLSGGIDPDDAFSRVPYEKGFYFLYYLQQVAGGDAPFEKFMKDYFAHFAHRSISSEDFRDYYLDYFKDVPATKDIDWDTWFFAPGMPPVTHDYDSSMGAAAVDLAKAWHTSDLMGIGSNGPASAADADIAGWGAEQITLFLDKLAEFRALQPLHPKTTRRMNELYGFDASTNAEIRSSWYRLCLLAGDTAVFTAVDAFLQQQGRMKYLRPLYKALAAAGSDGKALAEATFKAARSSYHPIAAKMVAADLGL